MVNMTGDSDSEDYHHLHTTGSPRGINLSDAQDNAESSSKYSQSEAEADPATALSTRSQPSPHSEDRGGGSAAIITTTEAVTAYTEEDRSVKE